MDHSSSSSGRQRNVSGSGSVGRHGSGLGTGPVGNSGGYGGRPGGGGPRYEDSGTRGPGGSRGLGGRGYGGMMPGASFGGGARGGRGGSGCLGKIIGIILVLLVISWLLRACFGGGDTYETTPAPTQQTQTQSQTQAQTAAQTTASSQNSSGQSTAQTGNTAVNMADSLTLTNNNGILDTSVREGSRIKYTDVANAESATVLVYICGSNLESESGMATGDLQEMIRAGLTEDSKVNVIAYTGGASKWKNNVISRTTNQISRVLGEGLEYLVKDDGDKAMTDPETLSSFITWGVKNYPADRYMLILWDHGAGSVLGYGYDEKHTSRGYMSLASIQDALQQANVRFDFVGYDACLMASVSNAVMLSEYADYMIASEETEPGTGWYYTNWLAKLEADPAISTVELGKLIADDYTTASSQSQRGATTTLSVTDLAELTVFAAEPFEAFSTSTSALLNSDEYKIVSDARAGSREFAQEDGLDQVDLIHLAINMGTEEGNELAQALQSAVKYNRTSSGYEKAYGLSEYFPWHSGSKVDNAIENFDDLGMKGEYASCIRTFANMQLTGQIASGGTAGSYDSMFGSLFGGNGYQYGGYGDYSGYGTYSSGDYNGYYGGYGGADYYNGNGYDQSGNIDLGTVAELIYLFGRNRSSVAGVNSSNRFIDTDIMSSFSSYVAKNSINPSHLKWNSDGFTKTLAFDDQDWEAASSVLLSAFKDDGSGYIDLGLDNVYQFDEQGRLVADNTGAWLALNGQIVAYYFLEESGEGSERRYRGYVPALVNEKNSDIYLEFNVELGQWQVTGYRNVYTGDQEGKGDKVLSFTEGDVIQPIADYYRYADTENGTVEYEDTYRIGDPILWQGNLTVTDMTVEGGLNEAYRITDIYGQNFWTEQM